MKKAKVSCAEALDGDNTASSGRELKGRPSWIHLLELKQRPGKYSKAMQRRGAQGLDGGRDSAWIK